MLNKQGDIMVDRKEYINEVAEKMKKWDDDLVALENKANSTSANLKEETKDKLQDLRIKKAELQGKLDKLKSSGEDAWEIMNQEFKQSFENIKKAFEDAKNILKN